MLFFRKNFFFLFLLFLGQLFFFQDVKAFSIFPVRYTLVVDAGKTAVASVQIYNDEDSTIQVNPEVDAFALDPDTGHTLFGQSDSAKSWVKANVSSLTLSPKEKRTVDFTITVPPGSPVQSHYLALFLKQKSGLGQVGLGKRIGSLLFLHVSGEVSEKMLLQDFSFEKKGEKRNVHLQAYNNGSIHLLPSGTLRLSSWWGRQISILGVNEKQRKVLPNAEWREILEIKNIGVENIGKVQVDLHLKYGLTDQIVERTIYFWYMPWWFIVFSVLFVVSVGAGIFLKRSQKL